MTAPRLIEVALPIREISAESLRNKSLRHGQIVTHTRVSPRPIQIGMWLIHFFGTIGATQLDQPRQ